MTCIVDNRQFHCTTSDVWFGPRFDSDQEGEDFRTWMFQNHGDPRKFLSAALDEYYSEWKKARRGN